MNKQFANYISNDHAEQFFAREKAKLEQEFQAEKAKALQEQADWTWAQQASDVAVMEQDLLETLSEKEQEIYGLQKHLADLEITIERLQAEKAQLQKNFENSEGDIESYRETRSDDLTTIKELTEVMQGLQSILSNVEKEYVPRADWEQLDDEDQKHQE